MEQKNQQKGSKMKYGFDYHFKDPSRGAEVELDDLVKAFEDVGYELDFTGGGSQYIVSTHCPQELADKIFQDLIDEAVSD